MTVKPGASVEKMTDALKEACAIIERCYESVECLLVLTSGDEINVRHSGRPVAGDTVNPHYLGKAADFRIWNVKPERRQELVDKIESELGEEFVVLWENQGHDNEHLHVQHGHVVP
jgi:hypothetical protein